jgi:predicted kinase
LALIVVSGATGTGKSTIAAALGAALRFPVLTLDPVKEAPLGLGAALVDVDTGTPGATERAVTAVRAGLR